MGDAELFSRLKDFEAVIMLSERLFAKKHPAPPMLCVLFAMWCAFRIRIYAGLDGVKDLGSQWEGRATDLPNGITALPNLDCVRAASETLMGAQKLQDQSAVCAALEKMGILALCPEPSRQFAKMRDLVGRMTGHAHVIALVEMARFASELEDHDRAIEYATEARSLDATECELYSICIVEGLAAFHNQMYVESARLLGRSTEPCQCDEYASLQCGVRALNVSLPEKLLAVGFRDEVSKYLRNCRDVWRSLRPQIDVWISLVGNGETLDFGAPKVVKLMNTPSFRLQTQWARIAFLEENPQRYADKYRIRKSRSEVLAGRERLRAEYRQQKDAFTDDLPGKDSE